MSTNILLVKRGIPWGWCTCHIAEKAAENAFGTSADPFQEQGSARYPEARNQDRIEGEPVHHLQRKVQEAPARDAGVKFQNHQEHAPAIAMSGPYV